MSISSRENILSLYRRTGFHHAPVAIDMCPSLWRQYKTIAGDIPLAEYFDYPEGFCERGLPGLKRLFSTKPDWTQYYEGGVAPGTWFDDFGVAHEPGSADAAHMTRMRHPMARFESIEQIKSYPFAQWDVSSEGAIADAVREAHNAGLAASGHMACTIWETAWYMRDMTRLMMDMTMGSEMATYLLDKVTELSAQQAAAFARAGADIIYTGDDIGMQNSIMLSLEMFREWLKPRLATVIKAAKAEKPDVLVQYHSCGYIEPFIPDLLECGVDILNPVQPECMDFGRLHAAYSDKLSFNGTLGTQTTMPFGTAAEVARVVHRNLDIAGSRGGLFVCPTHLLEPEVPWENIVAYVRACKEHGH